MNNKSDDKSFYSDSFAYDSIYSREIRDIKFYTQICERHGGSVLDLGCGTGRLTIPMAQKGIRVTGLDISPTMLDTAVAKSESAGVKIAWIEDDFIHFNLKQQFDCIIMGGCSFQHLENTKQAEECLERVQEHLKPKGIFAFDIFNPSLAVLAREPEDRLHLSTYSDQSGHSVTVEASNFYDRATQINHITWYYSRENARDFKVDVLKMRQYFPQEMQYLLKTRGFEITDIFGDFEGNRFTGDSKRQIFVVKEAKK